MTEKTKIVGIMSMQRIVNYGSFMQAYALKQTIESNINAKVHFIDYKYEEPVLKKEKNEFFFKVIKNLNIPNFFKKKKMQRKFIDYYNNIMLPNYLGIEKERNEDDYNIDTLIIGSDEVFNCIQPYPVGYSRNLFGYGYSDKVNTISYAASFGSTRIDMLKKYKIDLEVGEMLNKFSKISVRDQNSYDIVKKLTNSNPEVNLDPVLIYDFKEVNPKEIEMNNYIILYAYTGRLSKEEEIQIKKFAKRNDKKIVSLGFYQRIADVNIVVNPLDIFSYFKKADFVITDTFHGSIFAIKTHTKFCTLIRNGNKNKVYDMLFKLKKTDRILNSLDYLDEIYKKEIDFSSTDEILEKEKNKTIQYLKDNIL